MHTTIYAYCQKKRAAPKASSPTAPTAAALRAAFRRLLPSRQVWNLAALKRQSLYDRLFTPIVTLWYLLFQRLGGDPTLEKVLSDAHAGGADLLRPGLSRELRSTATTSYSDARQRLPLAWLFESLRLQAGNLLALHPPALWHGWVVCLLDGSTVRLRPLGDIPTRFARHHNQTKAPPYWCLMRVVVGFCARTGAALDGACSSLRRSEQMLACRLILRQAAGACLHVGDRNFGIFRVAQSARAVGSHVLLRLTQCRARRLLGRSLRVGSYRFLWSPTRQDQLQPGCPKTPIEGRLLVVQVHRPGYRSQTLYLFTTLTDQVQYPASQLVALYGLRWHVELNLRYLKTQMGLVQLECKSAQMAQKEWLAGLMAYNLIRAAMLCAALPKSLSPLALSFSLSRRHLQGWLALWGSGEASRKSWPKLLALIGRARLPRRRKVRPAEPRAQRHLRQPYDPLIGSRQKARQQLKRAEKCACKS
jgi:hypothetical protein